MVRERERESDGQKFVRKIMILIVVTFFGGLWPHTVTTRLVILVIFVSHLFPLTLGLGFLAEWEKKKQQLNLSIKCI